MIRVFTSLLLMTLFGAFTGCNNSPALVEYFENTGGLPPFSPSSSVQIEAKVTAATDYVSAALGLNPGESADLRWKLTGDAESCRLERNGNEVLGDALVTQSHPIGALTSRDVQVFRVTCIQAGAEFFDEISISLNAAIVSLELTQGNTQAFDPVTVGGISESDITLRNTGNVPIENITLVGMKSPFSLSDGSGCAPGILPGEVCIIRLEFSPSLSQGGVHINDTSITFTADGESQSQPFKLTGIGIVPLNADLNILGGDIYTFPDTLLDAVKSQTFTVINNGNNPAALTQPTGVELPYTVSASSSCLDTVLQPQAQCDFVVFFSPLEAGLSGVTIEIAYSDAGIPKSIPLTLRGVGIQEDVIIRRGFEITLRDFNPDIVYEFPRVSEPFTEEFTLINQSSIVINDLVYVGIGTDTSSTFRLIDFSDCQRSIPIGGSCKFEITYTPPTEGSGTVSTSTNILRDLSLRLRLRGIFQN